MDTTTVLKSFNQLDIFISKCLKYKLKLWDEWYWFLKSPPRADMLTPLTPIEGQ